MKIGLVQINSSFANNSYLPYSIGMLQSYAQSTLHHPERFEFLLPIFDRLPVKKAIEQLSVADAIFFSSYIWNINLSTAIAKAFKQLYPHRPVIFGGPQVPDHPETFLRQHPYIDLVIHNEGEQPFLFALECLATQQWESVPSASWINSKNILQQTPIIERIKNLSILSSPFLTGAFDTLMQRYPEKKWIAIWETDRGCPFSALGQSVITFPDKIFRFEEEEYENYKSKQCSISEHIHRIGKYDRRIICQDKHESLKILFSNGLSVVLGLDHPINIVEKEKRVMYPARQIKIGDWVAIERGQNNIKKLQKIPLDVHPKHFLEINLKYRPRYFGEYEAWLTGFLIGDGHISYKKRNKNISLAVTKDTKPKLLHCCKQSFQIKPKIVKINNTKKAQTAIIYSAQLVRFFTESLGVGIDKYKLQVPKIVRTSPKHIVKSFLEGLWEADGYSPKQKGKARYLTTISLKLAEEVAALINWIGDVSLVRTVIRKKSHKEDFKRPSKIIYRIEWHEDKCDHHLMGTPCIRSQIPLPYKIARPHLIHHKYMSTKPYKERPRFNTHQVVTRRKLQETFPNHPLLGNQWAYTKVMKIKNIGEQILYDAYVPTNKNKFSANGISVSNCSFCNWGSATQSKVYQFDLPRLYKELEWFAEKKIEYVFCANANFGILPRDIDIAKYAAEIKIKTGYPDGLSVQNTKNSTERAYQVQKILSDSNLNRGVVLSLQSTNPQTLKSIHRDNISLDTYRELQKRFTNDGVLTYTDLILALPDETYDSFVNGVSDLIQNGQHNRIQFNNLSLLPNTGMDSDEYQKKHGFEIAKCKEINIHGPEIHDPEAIEEESDLIIGTKTMPKEDWVRTRAFCWMAALLHFDKLLQIPIIIFHHMTSISYRDILESFFIHVTDQEIIIKNIQDFFLAKTKDIQQGGTEYVLAEQYMGIYWPVDEYWFIKLSQEEKLSQFYQEAERILNRITTMNPEQKIILYESMLLNKLLLKQPYQTQNIQETFVYNVLDTYRNIVKGRVPSLRHFPSTIEINKTSETWSSWDEWCKKVVWWENKKGAYLYQEVSYV